MATMMIQPDLFAPVAQEPGASFANEDFAEVRALIQEASDQMGATSPEAKASGLKSVEEAIDRLRSIKVRYFGGDC